MQFLLHLFKLNQSFIDCICLILFSVWYIYALSKCLPEWMHIHTGYICLNFLHCDLSSGSTKQLPKRTECYAGCICFAFNRCVFLNGSLNCLYWSMHSHICCICLTYPLGVCLFLIHMCPQGKGALFAFVRFSSTNPFKKFVPSNNEFPAKY